MGHIRKMFNPLLADLSTIKDIDIEKSITDLSKKYQIAARIGNNQLCFQIQIMIEQYQDELRSRNFNRSKKININDRETDLDTLINID